MPEESWFNCREGCEIFLFSQESRPSLGPTQLAVHWLLEAFSPAVMWLRHQISTHLHLMLRLRMSLAIPPVSYVLCVLLLYFVCKGFLDTNTTRFYTCIWRSSLLAENELSLLYSYGLLAQTQATQSEAIPEYWIEFNLSRLFAVSCMYCAYFWHMFYTDSMVVHFAQHGFQKYYFLLPELI